MTLLQSLNGNNQFKIKRTLTLPLPIFTHSHITILRLFTKNISVCIGDDSWTHIVEVVEDCEAIFRSPPPVWLGTTAPSKTPWVLRNIIIINLTLKIWHFLRPFVIVCYMHRTDAYRIVSHIGDATCPFRIPSDLPFSHERVLLSELILPPAQK